MEIVVPLFHMLVGVCALSGLYHLINGGRRPRNWVNIWFGLAALSMVPFGLFHVAAYQAGSMDSYVVALRWNIAAVLLMHVFFIWFIAVYTRVGGRAILWGATLWFTALFLLNLLAPYTVQYAGDVALERLRLPWGETLVIGRGEPGTFLRAGWLSIVLTHFAWIYALWANYRRVREPAAAILAVGIGVQTLTAVEGALVREGVLAFVHLGPFGYLLLIVLVSLVLDYQAWHRLRDSENRFRQLVEQCPLSIQVCAPDGRLLQANAGWEALWGVTPAQLTGYNILSDRQLVEKGAMPYIRRAFEGMPTEVPPIVYNPADNETVAGPFRDRWVCAHVYPVKDDRGHLREVILIHEDVTERKQVEEAIRHIASGVAGVGDEQFFLNLVSSLGDLFKARAVYLGVVDEHDPRRVRVLAMVRDGTSVSGWTYAIQGTPTEEVLQSNTCIFPVEVRRRFPGDRFLAEVNAQSYIGAPLLNAAGDPLGLIGIVDDKPMDLTGRVREILEIFAARASAEVQRLGAEARIRRMAYEDYLTGLGSRGYFHERLAAVHGEALQSGRYGALILMDLDHFKIINDALSHDVGDQLLRAVGGRLSEVTGDRAFIARFGGDEFVALLETGTDDIEAAEAVARELADELRGQLEAPIILGERALTIDASMGVVIFPAHEENELDVLRHADMALNSAKRQGRGNTQFYVPALKAAAATRLQLGEGLRSAIDNEELALHFQPQVESDGRVAGLEALLRWRHPVLGDVSPAMFIPVAEETGLIHSIGGWALTQACEHVRRWQADGLAFGGHVSVNVSAWQFIAPGFVQQVRDTIEAKGVDPRCLMLELTETALLYDLAETIDKLKELRSLGLGIALDDFGTGYSSLAYLKDLPLDQLKIDKAFTAELEVSDAAPLVETMVAIGRHMGLGVIAEGVESQRQRERLERMGCRSFQGFFFSPPLAEADLRSWLTGVSTGSEDTA